MPILLVSNDLMASSQVEGAALAAGERLQTCAAADAADRIAGEPDAVLVIVDLSAPITDLVELVHAAGGRPVVAFGPHVHERKLEAAAAAGCAEVLARGQFFRDPAGVIRRHAPTG